MRFAAFILVSLSLSIGSASSADQPNILFLFADDFTHEAIGMLGEVDVETPHLDKLAARSKVFTHAYNMGSWSGAVCVASRNMLNTGRYVWRAEKASKGLKEDVKQGTMWSQVMGQAGYQTFFTGKWHVPVDAEGIFDVARHVRPGMPGTVPSAYNRPVEGQADEWSPFDVSLGGFWEGGKHWSEVVADDAIDFFSISGGAVKPFFMYVAFNAPHDPRQAPEEFVKKYPVERVKVPENYQSVYPYAEEMKSGKGLRDEKLAPFPRTEYSVKVHRGEYFALITHLDEQVGRVLTALEASGKADNTWIFFSADHGLAVGHHGLLGKQNMYEHSLRVPFFAAGPGVEPGRIDAPIYLQDVMATSLDLAGAEVPEQVEFKSLLPLVKGESTDPTAQPVYGAYLDAQRAIIDGGWKLIAYPAAPKLRLYHLAQDPQEMKDLAEVPEQAEKVKEMFAKLVELQQSMEDELDLKPVFANMLGL